MRIIKFRSWDGRNKQMDYPDNIANGIDGDKYQIMQFTGLYDKNGKEIYEGDIIKSEYVVHGKPESDIGEVRFINGCTCYFYNDGGEHLYYPAYSGLNKYEIVGNIYENPKLIRKLAKTMK